MSTCRGAFSPVALLATTALALAGCTGRASGAPSSGPGPSVTVHPSPVSLLPRGTQSFRADASGLGSTAVTWGLEPAGCGTLTPMGALADYVAPATAGTTCTVRARSVADPGVSGTATVTVVSDTSGGAPGGGGTEYHVGAGQTHATLGAVPWYRLQAGDTVYVHPGTYHEKILISTSGTPTQWIRVRGLPDGSGNLPVISGQDATTSANNHWRWPTPDLVQWDALVAIAVSADTDTPPRYVEIASLELRDASPSYSFTAENGTTSSYEDFAACVYARSPVHLLVRDNVIHNCAQGFYNWTGSGIPADTWYSGLAADIVIRGNSFYDNGWAGLYTSHQTYTEADGVIIEGNRFGTPRAGMLGNQIKDRSAGTVVRYNWIEQSPAGYDIDLVEPQEGCPMLCYGQGATTPNARYLQAFVYGNAFVNRSVTDPNFIHWNEDHQASPPQGRAAEPDGRLYVYDNTIVDTTGAGLLFNQTYGAFECPAYDLPGRIDMRNNLVYATAGTYDLGEYCSGRPSASYRHGHFDFGANWVSPGYGLSANDSTGGSGLVSPAGNDPGFANAAGDDYRLAAGSSALDIGGALAPAVTSNSLGLDLTPTRQYVLPHATPTPRTEARARAGAGSDLGAFER